MGLSVGAIVMAFNNPPGNPTTGGGIIGVGSGAPAGSLYINSSGNVGIGTTDPGYKVVSIGDISYVGGSIITDATTKNFRIGALHYTNSEEPLSMLYGQTNASSNRVAIGGGTSYMNAATQLEFYTAENTTTTIGAERLHITSTGNVGIGTAVPKMNLQVGPYGGFFYTGNDFGILGNAYYSGGYKYLTTGAANLLYYDGGGFRFMTAVSGTADSSISWGTDKMVITNTGNVGIGTGNPGGYKLYVAGTIYTSSGCTGCSDARWKTNITPITTPLEKIMALTGEQFNWKTQEYPDMFFQEGLDYGLIAQDVEKVLPEIVYEVNGYKYIRYDRLSTILIEAIKGQQKAIESLKTENDALKVALCQLNPKAEVCR